MKIAFIGVGNMGGAVARRLASGGYTVRVYDPDANAMRRCEASGAQPSDSLEEAVQGAEVVLTSLPTTALVLSTVEAVVAVVPAGTTVVDVSTIDPLTAREASDVCDGARMRFVACALGKTPEHAERGSIPLFVGGDGGAVDELHDLWQRIGEHTYRFDDVEGATTFKLVSNFIGMTNVAVLAEGLALARRAGIDDEMFTTALADTGAASFQSQLRLPWMLTGDWAARFGVDLAAKDVGLAVESADAWKLPVPVGAAALGQLRAASDRGLGGQDVVALAKLVGADGQQQGPA